MDKMDKAITPVWIYIELVNKSIEESLYLIAMKCRVDASGLISHLKHHVILDTEPVRVNTRDKRLLYHFDTTDEYNIFIEALISVYGEPSPDGDITLYEIDHKTAIVK